MDTVTTVTKLEVEGTKASVVDPSENQGLVNFWRNYDLTVESQVYECIQIFVNFSDTFTSSRLVEVNIRKEMAKVGWAEERIREIWNNATSGKYTNAWVKESLLALGKVPAKIGFIG